jgi:hypothetical protein
MAERGPFSLPDLSGLDAALLANYWLSQTIGRGFPPGDTQHLVTAFIRSMDGTLRRYEDARIRLDRSSREDKLVEFIRGSDDLQFALISLHRTMRLAEGLMRSPDTNVSKRELPPPAERDQLRVMRNAIDHVDEPIIDGRAGQGLPLQLEVMNSTVRISDECGLHQVDQGVVGSWVETLHALAVTLTNEPHKWSASRRRARSSPWD